MQQFCFHTKLSANIKSFNVNHFYIHAHTTVGSVSFLSLNITVSNSYLHAKFTPNLRLLWAHELNVCVRKLPFLYGCRQQYTQNTYSSVLGSLQCVLGEGEICVGGQFAFHFWEPDKQPTFALWFWNQTWTTRTLSPVSAASVSLTYRTKRFITVKSSYCFSKPIS